MRLILTVATALTAIGLAAFAQQPNPQQNPPQNPQPVPQSPNITRTSERDSRADSSGTTAQEAAEMFRSAKHSLTDSIGTAERQGSGKAIAAHCCMKSQADVTYLRDNKSWPAGQPEVRRGGASSGTNEQKRDAQGRDTSDQGGTSTGEKGPVCIVTCLVGDNRLVEYVVCSKSNQVLAERPIDSLAGADSRTTGER